MVIGDPDQFPRTMFTPDRLISFGDVADGTSNTILVAEICTAVPWSMPGADLHFERMTFRVNGSPASISSAHSGIAQIALADGSVRTLDTWLDTETLRSLIQPADSNSIGEY